MSVKQIAWAHSLVADWFKENFGQPTEPQITRKYLIEHLT